MNLDDVVKELAEVCYIDQLRSDAAFHKKRDIRNILLKFKGDIISHTETKRRDLERRLYIAEAALADSKL